MFCPNCGTKNEDAVARCGQCGFELTKAKGSGGKFKGTVMMRGAPVDESSVPPAAGSSLTAGPSPTASPSPNAAAQVPAQAQVNARLKGTMVGVAPPGIDELAKAAQQAAAQKAAGARPGASNPLLKGTMVGVAPPSVEAPRNQVDATQPSAQASAADPQPNSPLKGTMIGLAPPNMQAEIAAARAKISEQKAAANAAFATPVPAAAPVKAPPSQLKGTMIGVAPPDVQAEIAAAKAQYQSARNAEPSPSKDAEPSPSNDAEPSPSNDKVNPLDGTMVGLSAFSVSAATGLQAAVPAQAALPEPSAMAAPSATADDFNDDTPAAFGEPQREQTSSLAAQSALSGEKQDHVRFAPLGDETEDPPSVAGLSKRSSSTRPLIMLVLLLLVAFAAIAALLLMKSEEPNEKPDGTVPSDSSSPASP